MKRVGVIVVVLIAVLFGLWFLAGKASVVPVLEGTSTVSAPGSAPAAGAGNTAAGGVAAGSGAADSAGGGSAGRPVSRGAPEPAADVSSKFLGFLVSESQQLDSRRVDVKAAEERMKEMVAALSPADIRYAGVRAMSQTGPANERIMSAYVNMQALATTPAGGDAYKAAREVLAAMVAQPGDSARAEPHSAAELNNAQAKSLTLMNIDALADRAAHEPAVRDDLARMEKDAKDPFFQKYIAEKLAKLGK
jgi:hypothetical protein